MHPTDTLGRPASLTDALGRVTTYTRDAVGNLAGAILPNGGQLSYTYDTLNRRTGTTDANNHTTTFNYAIGGDQTRSSMVDPRSNAYVTASDLNGHQLSLTHPDGSLESSTYNAVGKALTYTNRANVVRTNAYDSRNRLTSSNWNDGTTPTVATTYDAVGNTKTIDNGVSRITYTYDASNRLSSETQAVAGNPAGPQTITYSYDADGQRAGITYPDGTQVVHGHDAVGRMTSVSANGQIVGGFHYDAAGRRSGLDLADGTTTTYAYDAAGRVSNIAAVTTGGNTVATFAYGRDAQGNVSYVQHEDGRGDYFRYDGESQLLTAGYDATNPAAASPANPETLVAYAHDPAGNWSSLVATPAGGATVSHTLTASPTNVYQSDLVSRSDVGGSQTLPMQSDANSNSLVMPAPADLSPSTGFLPGPDPGGRSLIMTYDGENRPSSLVANYASSGGHAPTDSLTMQYDGTGRCVSRTFNGKTTYLHYDGWHLVAEHDGATGQQIASYIQGPQTDEILRVTTPTGDLYHHRDALGSVTHLTNTSGQMVEQYQYDAYGSPRKISNSAGSSMSSSAVGNRFLFAGREQLPAGGIYDLRHRIYNPAVGRFMQADPIRFLGGDVNIMKYANNSPLSFTDPMGLTVHGYYSISQHRLVLIDDKNDNKVNVNASSGNNNISNVDDFNKGPIPPGKYDIYTRSDPNGDPHQILGGDTYILDPHDGTPLNDTVDGGSGNQRFGFRLHPGEPDKPYPANGSEGCVTPSINDYPDIEDLFNETEQGPSRTIVSPNPSVNGGAPGKSDVFRGEHYLGMITVTK